MLKEIGKAILLRALSVIIAVSLVAAYARISTELRDRKGRKATEAQKAKADASMTQVSELLEALRAEIVAVMPKYEAATIVEQDVIRVNFLADYALKGSVIQNGSVHDIYLSSVDSMVQRAFTTKA